MVTDAGCAAWRDYAAGPGSDDSGIVGTIADVIARVVARVVVA